MKHQKSDCFRAGSGCQSETWWFPGRHLFTKWNTTTAQPRKTFLSSSKMIWIHVWGVFPCFEEDLMHIRVTPTLRIMPEGSDYSGSAGARIWYTDECSFMTETVCMHVYRACTSFWRSFKNSVIVKLHTIAKTWFNWHFQPWVGADVALIRLLHDQTFLRLDRIGMMVSTVQLNIKHSTGKQGKRESVSFLYEDRTRDPFLKLRADWHLFRYDVIPEITIISSNDVHHRCCLFLLLQCCLFCRPPVTLCSWVSLKWRVLHKRE